MGRVIAAAAYNAGCRVADIPVEDSGTWAAQPGHFVWIGIEAPSERDLRQLQAQFHLHELAIEDALNAHQRPKLETYGDTTFLVLRTAFLEDSHIALGETEIFLGPGLRHLGPPRRLGILRPGQAVRRGSPQAARPRRGLRALRARGLHRRQLPCRRRAARGRGPGARGTCARALGRGPDRTD